VKLLLKATMSIFADSLSVIDLLQN